MELYDSNDTHSDMTGHYGSGHSRNITPPNRNTQRRRHMGGLRTSAIGNLTAERWVDIICLSLISIFLISVFLNWNAFLDALFTNILFPIIFVGAKILSIVAGIGAFLGLIHAKFRRPRRWF